MKETRWSWDDEEREDLEAGTELNRVLKCSIRAKEECFNRGV